MIGKIDWCVEENNGNRCFVFTSVELHSPDENKLALKKYKELWDRMKNEIETTNGGKTGEYGKEFMKIKIWHQWWLAVE